MNDTKHTPASYDCSGPAFAMAEPARNSKAYWEDVAKKLAEHPCLVTELSAVRAINADMLAALEAVYESLSYYVNNPRAWPDGFDQGVSDSIQRNMRVIESVIARAKGGAK